MAIMQATIMRITARITMLSTTMQAMVMIIPVINCEAVVSAKCARATRNCHVPQAVLSTEELKVSGDQIAHM